MPIKRRDSRYNLYSDAIIRDTPPKEKTGENIVYTLTKSIVINRSPQEVFNYASDPEKKSQWQSDIKSAKWTSDSPYGVGSTYVLVRNSPGPSSVDIEITAWDPPNMTRATGVSGSNFFHSTETYEAQGDATLYTLVFQMELHGFFRLLERLVGKQSEKQVQSQLLVLKRILESGQV